MINGLANSGRVLEAKNLFDEIPERDSVSWNTMMSAYFSNGKPDDTLKLFALMSRDSSCVPNLYSFSSVMKACGCLGYLNLAFQLHGLVKKFDIGNDLPIDNSTVDMYIKCGAVDYAEQVFLRMQNPSLFCWNSMIYGYSKYFGVEKAFNIFNRMPERNSVSWSTMISVLSRYGFGNGTLCTFVEMCNQGFRPDSITYASAFSVCAGTCNLEWGTHLHARLLRMELSLDVSIGNGLIDMYAKGGRLDTARRVFNSLTRKDAISWTSLINGVAKFGLEGEAIILFNQMRRASVVPDEFTLVTVLGVFTCQNYLSTGEQFHVYTIKTGTDSSIPVGNALTTMYAKCGNTWNANHIFQFMVRRDIRSWTALLSAFSQAGDIEEAQNVFNKMPERSIVTWNAMISTYNQNGIGEEGLKLYNVMLEEGVKPDWFTFATTISTCADLAMLKLGMQIVAQAEKFGFCSRISVANNVITLYSKCGRTDEARKAFDSIFTKNLISWNAMMAGYAQNGQGKKVIEIFENMISMKCAPDHVSFVSILSGCSHSGLVREGIHYFIKMTKDYCISPTCEHFSCMVNLLGRFGLLEEAKSIIDRLPFKPTLDIWGALLGACRIHSNRRLAEIVLRKLLEHDQAVSASYILLASIYSDAGKVEGIAGLRKLMREKGLRKNPGCSWIEIDNRIHVFMAYDTSHPQIKEIYRVLEEINDTITITKR